MSRLAKGVRRCGLSVPGMAIVLLLAGCDCGAQSHQRDTGVDAARDAATRDAAEDATICRGEIYHRACGAPADPCASSCACRSDFILEQCNLDELGSCLGSLTFCEALEFRWFSSVDELECGLGPEGVETCNWIISFFRGRFEWTHSDVVESGTYTCDGDAVRGDVMGDWDGDRGILTWDGVDYEMAPQACPD